MDPVTIIVNALALGAAAGVTATAEQAVKDAYAGLKTVIQERYERARPAVELLESDPEQDAFQEAASKALDQEGAGSDEELLRQASDVIEAVERHAPETAATINVRLKDVKAAANLRIAELSASGDEARIDVDVKGAEAGDDFEIRGLRAGGESDSKKEAGQ